MGTVTAVTANSIQVTFDTISEPPAASFQTAILLSEGTTGAMYRIPHITGKAIGAVLPWKAVAPAISIPSSLVLVDESGRADFTFVVTDADHPDSDFEISFKSSDKSVVDSSTIATSKKVINTNTETGATTYRISFKCNDYGTAKITISATDNYKLTGRAHFTAMYRARVTCSSTSVISKGATEAGNNGVSCNGKRDYAWNVPCDRMFDNNFEWGPDSGFHLKSGEQVVEFDEVMTITAIRVYELGTLSNEDYRIAAYDLKFRDIQAGSDTYGDMLVAKAYPAAADIPNSKWQLDQPITRPTSSGMLEFKFDTPVQTTAVSLEPNKFNEGPRTMRILEVQIEGCK